MSSNTYSRVKIIPYPDGGAASATSNNNNNNNQNTSSSKQIPIALQFALHNLAIPNHHHHHHDSSHANNNTNNVPPPPARTLFFCIASDQLFPTEEALSQVCADPVDFSRICAKFGRGGEVPRPDFVGGYTRAIPTAQKVHQQKQLNELDDDADVTQAQDENNHRGKHNTTTFTKWVYVAEARVTVSEHILASLLGETTHEQQFFVLFTTAFFDRSLVNNNNSSAGDDTSLTGRRRNTGNDDYHNDGLGSARSRFSSNPEQVFGRPLVKIKGDHHHHHSAANTKKNKNNNTKPEFDHNQTGRRRGSSQQQHQHQSAATSATSVRLARENAVCVVDLSPELISADLEVKFGPHDRSWLHRFMSMGSTKRKNNNIKNEKEEDNDGHIDNDTNKNGTGESVVARGGASGIALLTGKRGKRKVRDPFEAAKQLCTHRLHIGDDEMMREMAVKFNEFLIGSTQDARRFCSFHAARMRIPIVFEHGMRSPQCQVFLQFLRSMRTLVSKKCIPEPPPHVASSIHHSLLKAEFLEERPLLEVIADLSVRFDRYHHQQQNVIRASSNNNNNNNKEDLSSSSPPTNDDDIEWNGNNITKNTHPRHSPLEDPSLDVLEENSDEDDPKNHNKMNRNRNDNENNNTNQHHKNNNNNRLLLPHEQRGYYGPEVRSVFAPWRIEWLDFLLLVCVETRLWREIFVLIERFYELSDAKLLSHPEYNHEETALRINLFANAQDIEEATGYPVELRDAVRIATRCSQFCKASPANRALVFRIRHMTQVPYVQRILFDPKICMFEELCCGSSGCNSSDGGALSSSSATLGRILWCLLVPLKIQQHVSAVIGRRDNGVPMVTTPKVAARQFRAFVLSSHIGDQAFKQLILRRFLGWVQLIRERRIKRKQQMQLQMSVRTSMVQNMDSRKTNFVKWMNHTKKMMKLRREGKIPPREQQQRQQPQQEAV